MNHSGHSFSSLANFFFRPYDAMCSAFALHRMCVTLLVTQPTHIHGVPMSAEAEESEAHKGAQSKLQSLVNSLVDQKTGAIASVDDARRLHDAMKEEMSLMGRLVLAEVVKTSAQSEEGCERLKPLVEEGLLATIIQWVEEAQQDSKHMTIPRFLEVLESLPVTLRALQESNAGSTVNRLRKCSFNDDRLKDTQRKVQQSAAAIVKKWRVSWPLVFFFFGLPFTTHATQGDTLMKMPPLYFPCRGSAGMGSCQH